MDSDGLIEGCAEQLTGVLTDTHTSCCFADRMLTSPLNRLYSKQVTCTDDCSQSRSALQSCDLYKVSLKSSAAGTERGGGTVFYCCLYNTTLTTRMALFYPVIWDVHYLYETERTSVKADEQKHN
ncbi:hypothetical protein CHARACLAT_014538 [Characodon lateralis]|uniref:Uncharacterized protein n=1 Tax=Characodon lateralis TaxID=208331 RepID=A0ABU7EJ74_9TELE|nr:hypothetical protein [Characodon lateralis]